MASDVLSRRENRLVPNGTYDIVRTHSRSLVASDALFRRDNSPDPTPRKQSRSKQGLRTQRVLGAGHSWHVTFSLPRKKSRSKRDLRRCWDNCPAANWIYELSYRHTTRRNGVPAGIGVGEEAFEDPTTQYAETPFFLKGAGVRLP